MSTAAAATYSTIEQIQSSYDTVSKAFLSGVSRPIEWRERQLKQLGFMIQDNEQAFIDALKNDLNRSEFESVVAELNPLKADCLEAIAHLSSWSKPRRVKTALIWSRAKATITPQPKGVTLIISTWNYPVNLLLGPLVGAISAGCTAIIKPAEQAEAVSALVARLLPKYLDTSAYQVVTGAVEQTTKLLSLRYDHIFFTGSGQIGKIVARAAAEHHCSTTLELGGKSPAIVLDDCNVKVTGRRLAWSKYVNSAQTCIAADYVLTTKEMQPKLIAAIKEALVDFNASTSGEKATSLAGQTNYAKIINKNHFDRLSTLLEKTSGKIEIGGEKDAASNKIAVTIVSDVKLDDALMQAEIFGPILPIVIMETKDEMVNYIASRDHPLALYVFTQDNANRDYIFDRTRPGGFVMNDTIVQFAITGLPFGGTGPSGQGNYHGEKSFLAFSHERASAIIPNYLEILLASRYPPYTPQKLKMMLLATKAVLTGRPGESEGLKVRMIFQIIGVVLIVVAGFKKIVG